MCSLVCTLQLLPNRIGDDTGIGLPFSSGLNHVCPPAVTGIEPSAVIVTRILAAVGLCGSALLWWPPDIASASDCPDVEVVFARGTGEPPGVGWIGQQFVDALRWRTLGRSVGVYPVDFPSVPEFGPTVAGVADAAGRVADMSANCPGTALVLGGYSRGAALVGYVTGSEPAADGFPAALPSEAVDRVAAVALLGRPSAAFLSSLQAPPLAIGPGYAAKTIELCAPADPVCSAGDDGAAHAAYAANGMVGQAADFAAARLTPPETPPEQPGG